MILNLVNQLPLDYYIHQRVSLENRVLVLPNHFHLSKKPLYKSLRPSTGGTTLRLNPLILTASRTFSNLFLWSRLICLMSFSYQSA